MIKNHRDNVAEKVLTIVLAGGRGTRLMNLTEKQAKPAVPFGGSFRIIDFTLSNCMNSGFHRVMILTQYQSESLSDYLTRVWNPVFKGENKSIDLLPPGAGKEYEGTADAVFKNIELVENNDAEWVLILAGDHIYKMDYAALLDEHIRTKADVTIPCIEVPRGEATGFGVMHTDASGRIIDFIEKPANPPGMPDNPEMSLASMGIYMFNRKLLLEILNSDAVDLESEHDFGKDIIPDLVPRARVMAHRFSNSCVRSSKNAQAYWRDVGTIDHYWSAHMDMTHSSPELDLNDRNWPIFKEQDKLPPAQFINDDKKKHAVIDSVVSPGCVISDSDIRKSMLFTRVKVGAHSDVHESVVLPGAIIGKNVSLKKAIVEHGCHIPDGLKVGENPEEDARRFYRTGHGVVLITRDMVNALH
ncbi:MAG: glgC [Alphaproteobacteria bacterium]|nr:glgC [Alphaproteobacteria bacterium]